MRLRIASGVIVAVASLAVSERPALSPKIFGVDPSGAPPLFNPPEFAPALGGNAFDPENVADKTLWDKYLKKGDHMMCLMEATDAGAGWLEKDPRKPPSAASKWTGDLRGEHNLFIISIPGDQHFRQLNSKNGSGTSRSLGLNSQSKYDDEGDPQAGSNDCYSIQHYDEYWVADPDDEWGQTIPIKDQKYKADGKEYTATAGVYQFAINHDGGLIAKNIESPRHAVLSPMSWGRSAKPGELPAIEYASDVFWAYWVRDNPNVKNFRVYGAHNVINTDTTLLVARALKNVGTNKLSVWPGNVFNIGSEEFRVLIGSPIGATAGHLLAAHKAELGIKRITKVTVIKNEKSPFKNRRLSDDLHVFFSIGDVSPAEVTRPDEPVGVMDSRIASVRKRGKNVIRVHTVMA
ncbi:hypothetical protein AG0111_0g10424 [Alternaria gaisen]|uniref:Uncharacterized protein n=1 Tax=Alternaria gaisen TaxID=167740 RepID=A0ACB6FA71_9PLEO|nr:hypothetical protein AG0111_0g10424 [Alternaria gaisen]